MVTFAIFLLYAGYGLCYYGMANLKSGGAGPAFTDTFGIPTKDPAHSGHLIAPAPQGSSNQTGQPSTSNPSPAGVVRTT